jgi:hypothetical protein
VPRLRRWAGDGILASHGEGVRNPGDHRAHPGEGGVHRPHLRHDPAAPSYGLEAAAALGVDPRVFKTLLVEADGRLGVGIVAADRLLDLKAIASALGAKKAVMADPAVAERSTGYVVGGISPIGQSGRCQRCWMPTRRMPDDPRVRRTPWARRGTLPRRPLA